MKKRVRWTSLWKTIPEEQEPSEPVGPVVAQEPSDEKPERKELPTESHEITPDQEKEDEGPPEIEGPGTEADLQDLAQINIVDKGRQRPDVKNADLPKAEAGMSHIRIQFMALLFSPRPDVEADLQELALPKTEGEGRKGPDIQGEILPIRKPIEVAEVGPDTESDLQDLAQLNIGDESRHGLDVKEAILPKAESIYMAEAGDGQPQE
ncbi:putative G antigen family E member 3 [Pteropus vampyrus]|uniref:G antigen family E member 3 n=1 Tax=Pteropus vampyrus TaxID=132908 RepID=A0A6P6C5W9_PTEVA|nr:putative G antigen family E member 3 [Pteropus vampyrus]